MLAVHALGALLQLLLVALGRGVDLRTNGYSGVRPSGSPDGERQGSAGHLALWENSGRPLFGCVKCFTSLRVVEFPTFRYNMEPEVLHRLQLE